MNKKEIEEIAPIIKKSFNNIKIINLQELGIRKKISVFLAKDLCHENTIIFYITQKSRFLQKDVDKMEEIKNIILNENKLNTIQKKILIESPLCSKAKVKLEESLWEILD